MKAEGKKTGFACRALLGAAALLAAAVIPNPLQDARANGDTRALHMYHNHTGERIDIVYKRDGAYDREALKKIDWFLRDWRKGEATEMDPRLFDLIWEVYRDLGAKAAVHIICGYRNESTNSMLRARSSGVARHSQHMEGRAMDIAIPGVPTERLREMGMVKQKGGVGFYPKSGTPFVHLDVGSVRAWPRMTTMQLARLFPSGETLHLPSDGPPLDGYSIALAKLGRDGKRGEPMLAFADSLRPRAALRNSEAEEALTVAAVPQPKYEPLPLKIVAAVNAPEIPVPQARPAKLMMASVAPVPMLRPSVLTAQLVPSAPKAELTALRYDARATAGFFRAVTAERATGLTAPKIKLAANYLGEPVDAEKTFGPRKWIRASAFVKARVQVADSR